MPSKKVPVDISFLVTANCKPEALRITLGSLLLQTGISREILVSNNSKQKLFRDEISRICEEYKVQELQNGCADCYEADNYLATYATGRFLCFPSEEDYYTPIFGRQLRNHADRFTLDLCYCDCVYDPRITGSYEVMRVQPRLGHIDKGGFLLRRELFQGFPSIPDDPIVAAFCDGFMIEKLRMEKKISFGKVCEVLWVHN